MSEEVNKEKLQEDEAEKNTNTESETKPEKKKKEKRSKDKEELEKLKEELESYKQNHLRVLAEYDNYRKRTANEKTQIYNNAVADAVNAILPVADNIDRALAQENASADDMRKGVEMISNQFTASFEKLGITALGNVGDKFDPEIHNAVSHIESDDFGENEISAVFQKGYKLGDKMVRHAMVQVAN